METLSSKISWYLINSFGLNILPFKSTKYKSLRIIFDLRLTFRILSVGFGYILFINVDFSILRGATLKCALNFE